MLSWRYNHTSHVTNTHRRHQSFDVVKVLCTDKDQYMSDASFVIHHSRRLHPILALPFQRSPSWFTCRCDETHHIVRDAFVFRHHLRCKRDMLSIVGVLLRRISCMESSQLQFSFVLLYALNEYRLKARFNLQCKAHKTISESCSFSSRTEHTGIAGLKL